MTGLASSISGFVSKAGASISSAFGGLLPDSGSGGAAIPAANKTGDFLNSLSTGLSLASVVGGMFAANEEANAYVTQSRQEARALELTAQEDLLQARTEEIKGKQDSNRLMDELIQTIATQRLAAAASGVDPNFGTPVSVENSTRKIANLQQSITREDALIRSLSRRRQAAARQEEAINVRAAGSQRASAAKLTGMARAGGTLADLALRRAERGDLPNRKGD